MAEFLAAQPAWLIFMYLVGGSVLLAAVATQFVHRRMKAPLDEKHNEVAGLIFATVSVLYAVLLAFVVIAVWEQFSAAEHTAAQEATAIIAAARTCTSFPEPARQQVHDLLIEYSNLVINEELAGAKQGKVDPDGSPQALAVLNHIWAIYRGLPPNAVDSETTASLNNLSQERNLRLLESEATLPSIFWPILAIGAVITTVLGLLLHLQNGKVRVLTVALLACTMALCLWLILELNYPFTGDVSVAAAPFYEHAIYVIKSLPR